MTCMTGSRTTPCRHHRTRFLGLSVPPACHDRTIRYYRTVRSGVSARLFPQAGQGVSETPKGDDARSRCTVSYQRRIVLIHYGYDLLTHAERLDTFSRWMIVLAASLPVIGGASVPPGGRPGRLAIVPLSRQGRGPGFDQAALEHATGPAPNSSRSGSANRPWRTNTANGFGSCSRRSGSTERSAFDGLQRLPRSLFVPKRKVTVDYEPRPIATSNVTLTPEILELTEALPRTPTTSGPSAGRRDGPSAREARRHPADAFTGPLRRAPRGGETIRPRSGDGDAQGDSVLGFRIVTASPPQDLPARHPDTRAASPGSRPEP